MADDKAKSSQNVTKSKTKIHQKKKAGDDVSEGEESGSDASSESVEQKDDEKSASQVFERSGSQVGRGLSKSHVYIDRDEYLQAHRDLTFERNQLQIKNNILHRRMAEYYKKRKLDHVLKPLEGSLDLEEKYQQKLIAYEEFKEKEELECQDLRSKVQEVQTLYESQEEIANAKFKVLQDHERNTGSGLIYAKKGKPISDKTVHRFLSLQKSKTMQARAMMLRYIRVRNAVMEQEAIIKGLEKIGPGLYVAAYEQLKVDNLNYINKIEERDDELIKNRSRCTEHNQILAHIREKMHHTAEVIDSTECDLGEAEMEFQKAREELTVAKRRRDLLRIYTDTEYKKAGLIIKRSLLRDFQESREMVEKMRHKKTILEGQITKMNAELRQARKCITNSPTDSSISEFDVMP